MLLEYINISEKVLEISLTQRRRYIGVAIKKKNKTKQNKNKNKNKNKKKNKPLSTYYFASVCTLAPRPSSYSDRSCPDNFRKSMFKIKTNLTLSFIKLWKKPLEWNFIWM